MGGGGVLVKPWQCWVELQFHRNYNNWTAFQIVGPDLQFSIPITNLTEEVNRVIGEEQHSEGSADKGHWEGVPFLPPTEVTKEHSMQSEPEIIRIHHTATEEEQELIARAESLHISEPQIMATRTEEQLRALWSTKIPGTLLTWM